MPKHVFKKLSREFKIFVNKELFTIYLYFGKKEEIISKEGALLRSCLIGGIFEYVPLL